MTKQIRYKCLILDHDDTAVDSTASIHYPAHLEVMKQIRPKEVPVSLEGWFTKNFDPGIMEFLKDELKFSETEMQKEYDIWREYSTQKIPTFYSGFINLLNQFHAAGGIVTVVSHSDVDVIQSHYQNKAFNGTKLPHLIYGWDMDPEKRKPAAYPVNQILKTFNLQPYEALIVDDLKPAVVMAKKSGVPVAAAGWCHQIPVIQQYMKINCDFYLDAISDLNNLIFK
ncbi:MAG: HAD hydrolase-like protein [Deltaproteobacteria bacterium]|jgi:phosphoglycolate phosphatase-like HAD superfamily hydrolase|nr:HAD hydrolase-like protein [Deltaproteobacteria bacterium]